MDWCTRTAACALAPGGQRDLPVDPGGLAPGVACVTCRTLTSVLARDRSKSFCRFLTLGQSCSCAAVKIRCRSRRTCPSCARQSILPPLNGHHTGLVLRSVRCAGRRCPGHRGHLGVTQVPPSQTGVEKL